MVELSDEQAKKIDEVLSSIVEIRTVLLGAKGEEGGGLCAEVKELQADHTALKRNFWMLIALLVGSGILGGGLWALIAH